jgi:exopolyphosphatase/pppGpp-phosphohydrolase
VGRLGVEPARQDTLAIGAVVIATLMELLGASSALVSDRGLREGVLARELAKLPAAE